jgi:hypothetical protein
MKFLIDTGAPKSYFKEYLTMDMSPHHIHKTKAEHKYAVISLSAGISKALAENSELFPQSLSQRFDRLLVRSKKELR